MVTAVKVQKIGTVRFNDLMPAPAWDVASAIAAALNARRGVTEDYDPEFVHVQGAKAATHAAKLELDLVMVDPGKFKVCTPEVLELPETSTYEKAWKEGQRFPPVVINSRLSWRKMLQQGRRRACAASRAGLTAIEAIDIAVAELGSMDAWIRERQE